MMIRMSRYSKFSRNIILFLFLVCVNSVRAAYILIPMDETQKNHLKAYGIAYWTLKHNVEVDWLLNYRGGSFMFQYAKPMEDECAIRGVSFEVIADAQAAAILTDIADPQVNQENIKRSEERRVGKECRSRW